MAPENLKYAECFYHKNIVPSSAGKLINNYYIKSIKYLQYRENIFSRPSRFVFIQSSYRSNHSCFLQRWSSMYDFEEWRFSHESYRGY